MVSLIYQYSTIAPTYMWHILYHNYLYASVLSVNVFISSFLDSFLNKLFHKPVGLIWYACTVVPTRDQCTVYTNYIHTLYAQFFTVPYPCNILCIMYIFWRVNNFAYELFIVNEYSWTFTTNLIEKRKLIKYTLDGSMCSFEFDYFIQNVLLAIRLI